VMPNPSHIVPVMAGDRTLCKAACDELLHRHRTMSSGSITDRAAPRRAPGLDLVAITQVSFRLD
jgi:hypothetical protein